MEPVLVAKNLSKKYGTVVALESANLELYPGEVLGVIPKKITEDLSIIS